MVTMGNKVKAQMVLHGDNASKLCKALKISPASMSGKLRDRIPWKRTEIDFIINRYSLSADEVMDIFFAQNVAKSETDIAESDI